MYVDDFFALVRRNQAPQSIPRYIKTRFGPADVITVADFAFPRRYDGDEIKTGHSEHDWYLSSFICNMTTQELPRWDIDGIWAEPEQIYVEGGIPIIRKETPGWLLRPATGYKPLLMTFLEHGLIVPSWELDQLLHYDTRRTCAADLRLLYIPKPEPADDVPDCDCGSEHLPPCAAAATSVGQCVGTDLP